MATELIKTSNLKHAAELLEVGKLVAFPTDTFFALGAILEDAPITELFKVKGRMAGNPVPVLLASIDQVQQVSADPLTETELALAQEFWPGPFTLVLTAQSGVPASVAAGTGKIGVRLPDHDLARELIGLVGSPLTGTSANRSGSAPCKTVDAVLAQLQGDIAAAVDAPCGDRTAPSTVVSLENGELNILRAGAISELEIRQFLDQL